MKKPKDPEKASECWPVSKRQKRRKGEVMPFCVRTQKGRQTNRDPWWLVGTAKGILGEKKDIISSGNYLVLSMTSVEPVF